MFTSFWFAFIILLLAALFGSIAIIPYSLRLIKGSSKGNRLKLPVWGLVLLSILQNSILFAVAVSVGLLFSHQIGKGAPVIDAFVQGYGLPLGLISELVIALLLGILGGSFLLYADTFFLPYFPKTLLSITLETTDWENFAASFYGGINEEIFMRLCGMSLLAWFLLKIVLLPVIVAFWIANGSMALLFALGHLPALKSAVGKISHPLFLRTILLNTPIGLLCGWVFWQYGIEAAILTHFMADIVYHVGGTRYLRSQCKNK